MSPLDASKVRPKYLQAAEQLRENAQQWAAYESPGDCVMLAGPGSGKTKTLTIKFARMIAEDVREPRGIACITYSNECARELTRKLGALGVSESRQVFVGTVHSFCLRNVLIPYASLAGLDIGDKINVANSTQEQEALASAMEELATDADTSETRIKMDWYRRTYVDRDSPQWRIDSVLAALVERYEAKLRNEGLIDFDDMAILGLRLVESYIWVRKALKARFPILVIDEYQDLGVPLHRLVLRLRAEGVRIFAVGDPNQSIYGFTGANPKLLGDLAAMEGIEVHSLKLNYRCGGRIVRASQVTLQKDMGYTAAGDYEGTIEIHPCQTGTEDQAKMICESIIPAIRRRRPGIKLGDIAILYMDRYDGDIIAREVLSRGWRFVRMDKGAPYPKTPLTRWLEDCAAWCNDGWTSGNPPRLTSITGTLGALLGLEEDASERLAARRQLVRFLWSRRSGSIKLRDWLESMYNNCLKPHFADRLALPEQEAWDKLSVACANGGALEHFTVSDFSGQRGASDHLNLSTLYSSKGLEFDAVILVGMENGKLPKFNATLDEKEEARRLFYVGITRARFEVHITYAQRRWSHRKQKYYATNPSEFVVEVWNSQ